MKKSYQAEIERANRVLATTTDNTIWKEQGKIIAKGINGMVAAFSVSIAMTNLLPTVLYYYADKAKRRKVLQLIVDMLNDIHNDYPTLEDFLRKVTTHATDPALRQLVVDNAIGLKYIIRTYKQEEP